MKTGLYVFFHFIFPQENLKITCNRYVLFINGDINHKLNFDREKKVLEM